jgi:hypothetical protein
MAGGGKKEADNFLTRAILSKNLLNISMQDLFKMKSY